MRAFFREPSRRRFAWRCASALLLLVLLCGLCETGAAESAPDLRTITVSAVGDCTLGRNQNMDFAHSWDYMFRYRGSRYFLQNVAALFQEDDLTVANLECVLSETAEPLQRFYRQKAGKNAEKTYTHLGKPAYLKALRSGGVDVLSFANNHNIDGGLQGFADTVDACEKAGMPLAYYDTVVRQEVNGLTVGVLSVDTTYCSRDVAENYLRTGMAELNRDCDLILVCMHWGSNYQKSPNSEQKYFGHLCVDLGADLVLGCHAHILQGVERYKGRYICYSLANFTYGGRAVPKDNDTVIVRQTFTFLDGELQVDDDLRLIPCWMSGNPEENDFCPTVKSGKAGEQILEKINSRSRQFGLSFDEKGRPLAEAAKDTELPPLPVAAEPLRAERIPEILYVLLGLRENGAESGATFRLEEEWHE